jgi:tape measure domain-containing protein
MTFKGASFLNGVASVIGALDKLKSSLGNLKGTKGLSDLDAAGKKVDLSHIADGVDKISSKFNAMSAIAVGALMRIGGAVASAAGNLVKSFTIAPIIDGLHEYEASLNTIAVIQANTGLSGAAGMKKIEGALQQLNLYADKTIYNFQDMTHAIGLFTAAGVPLDKSVSSIKGISNLAALSGSSAQQASTAMYQLSQAIATGTVKLMDWNSVVNAGMGGKVFQKALIQTAKVHGVNVDAMIKKNGSFRDSLQEGWLTSDIMTQTLATFTGDLSAAQLKAMGYTDEQTKAIMKQAQAAQDAATKVRTMSQMFSTLKEAVGSAWADVFHNIFGNMDQATTLWTGVTNSLSKAFVSPINHLATLLGMWNKLGGRTAVINGLTSGMRLLGQVLRPVKEAFREVFPPMTAQRLVEMSKSFEQFMGRIKISSSTLNNIKTIFKGLFDAIKVGVDIVKGIFSVFGKLISAATGVGGGILGLVAKVASLITGFRHVLETSGGLEKFFGGLGNVLAAPVKVLSFLVSGIDNLASAAGRALLALKPFAKRVAAAFGGIKDALVNALRSGDLSNVANLINQGLLGGILLAVRGFIKKITGLFSGGGGGLGLMDQIKKIFSTLTDSLKAMQDQIKAGTLEKIAIAVGVLAASVFLLSTIDPGGLSKSLTALGVMFGQLLFAMNILGKISTGINIFGVGAAAASMVLMAGAIVILAGAMKLLSTIDWNGIAKGIVTVAAMMVILVAAVKVMSSNSRGLISAAAAMILMAVAINILAGAVAILGRMNIGSLAKGVGTIAALLLVMAAFNKFGGKQIIETAASLLLIAVALNAMAIALKIMGSQPMAAIGKALLELAGALIIIAVAMRLMPDMLVAAAGLLVVSVALTILSKALASMGGMSWGAIGKSMVVLAGALVILAAAMIAMAGALPGAAALLVISAALMILVPVLITLGSLSWGTIIKGFVALAGAFIIFGAAGYLLAPVTLVLIGLAAAMALFGAGMFLLGAGIVAIGAGLTAIGVAVLTAGAAIVSFVTSILNLIPFALQKIGQGIVMFAQAISKGGAAITAAFTTILTSILQAIIKVVPLVGKAVQAILTTMLNLIANNTPRIVNTMIRLVMALLTAIAARMPQFVQKGSDIIVAFLNGIARNIPRIAQAGGNVVIAFINAVGAQAGRITSAAIRMIINFVNTLASQIRGSSGAMQAAGANLAGAIIDGMTFGLASKAGAVISKAASIGSSVISALGKAIKFFSPSHYTYAMGIGIIEGLMFGMTDHHSDLIKATEDTGAVLLKALENSVAMANDMVDLNPTITPVIDLSQAQRGFDDLAAMTQAGLSPTVATTAAATISDLSQAAASAAAGSTIVAGGTNVTFHQTNTSPVALSSAEIYRQTKNQLSQVKGALP